MSKKDENGDLLKVVMATIMVWVAMDLLQVAIEVILAAITGIPLIIPISFYFCRKKGAQGEDTDKK